MASVEFRNVTKKFGDVVAVNNVNFKARDREFLILVGPSGCGKSTTLRMVAGLEEVTEGEIYIGEELVNDLPPKDRILRWYSRTMPYILIWMSTKT